MKYFVVRWSAEDNQFSVIKDSNLVNGTIRANPIDAVGKEIKVFWKNEEFDAVLVAFGNKRAMDKKCDELADSACAEEEETMVEIAADVSRDAVSKQYKTPSTGNKKKKKRRRLENILSKINVELPTANEPEVDAVVDNGTDWHALYINAQEEHDSLELKFRRLKEKYRKLKVELRNLKAETDETAAVAIADGVAVKSGALATAKLISNGPTSLARNLFRIVFSKDELEGRSLFGKMCNANKSHTALPSIDCMRRDAVIQYCLRSYGYYCDASSGKGTVLQYRCMKKEIAASLSKYIREVNKPRSFQTSTVEPA